jgi:SAM-dependent methyltransferase
VLELGCGHGVISQVLVDAWLTLYVMDSSPSLLHSFRERFPDVQTECAAAEESAFFHRSFDGLVAWGLIFPLPEETQRVVLTKAANALAPGGKFLFTAPREAVAWNDAITRLESRAGCGGERGTAARDGAAGRGGWMKGRITTTLRSGRCPSMMDGAYRENYPTLASLE